MLSIHLIFITVLSDIISTFIDREIEAQTKGWKSRPGRSGCQAEEPRLYSVGSGEPLKFLMMELK